MSAWRRLRDFRSLLVSRSFWARFDIWCVRSARGASRDAADPAGPTANLAISSLCQHAAPGRARRARAVQGQSQSKPCRICHGLPPRDWRACRVFFWLSDCPLAPTRPCEHRFCRGAGGPKPGSPAAKGRRTANLVANTSRRAARFSRRLGLFRTRTSPVAATSVAGHPPDCIL